MWKRTQAGLAATGARDRPKKLDAFTAEMAQRLYNDKSNAIDIICKTLGISPGYPLPHHHARDDRQCPDTIVIPV